MAFLLTFGGGALLAALTIDLIAPGIDRGTLLIWLDAKLHTQISHYDLFSQNEPSPR